MITTTTGRFWPGTNERAPIKCPYCGKERFYPVSFGVGPFTVCCDSDEGCDRYFAAKATLTVTVTAMPIDDGEATP